MQTIQSRLYTNVILTAIAILLAVLALAPYLPMSTPAFAIEPIMRNQQQRARNAQVQGAVFDEFAKATLSVAEANKDIARAIREAAKSQKDIAKAIDKLGSL